MLPHFILGGIMKSGTTLLHNLLGAHPQISLLERNMNYSFFDDDRVFSRGFDWYQQLFSHLQSANSDNILVGQTSADCAFNPQSVSRIMAAIPNVKLIFVLRHPIDRAYSLYWHQYGMGREYYRFEKAIALEPRRIKKSYYNFKHYSYMERSRYRMQFDDILSLVPSENILLLPFDSLIQQTLPTVNKVLEFLKVSLISDIEELNFSKQPRNSAKFATNWSIVLASAYLQKLGFTSSGRRLINFFKIEQRPPAMPTDCRRFLEEELKEDIEFFEALKHSFNISLLS
jgi:hypothetical protein